MPIELFVLAVALGAALLAAWTYVRFPAWAPQRLGRTVVHVAIAFVLLQLAPSITSSPVAAFASIFLLLLPALVYAFLCTLWLLKFAQQALGMSR